MNLYLVRHADAIPLGEQGVSTDEERPLSERGVKQVERLAQGLKRLGIPVDRIFTSPLRRAVQTAEELCRGLQLNPAQLTSCDELAPGQSAKKLAKFLLKAEGENHLLVGHEPELGQHTAWLIGDKEARIAFAKSGVACVTCDGVPQKGSGTLCWLLTPKWLTALSATP
jgi:phosphohistidine phosphatase